MLDSGADLEPDAIDAGFDHLVERGVLEVRVVGPLLSSFAEDLPAAHGLLRTGGIHRDDPRGRWWGRLNGRTHEVAAGRESKSEGESHSSREAEATGG